MDILEFFMLAFNSFDYKKSRHIFLNEKANFIEINDRNACKHIEMNYLPRTTGLSFSHGKLNILSFIFPFCNEGTRPENKYKNKK